MFYTYVLKSGKDNQLYLGHTGDLLKRIEEHNRGRVRSTKKRTPFILVYRREFATRSEARWQEREWKTARGHRELAKLIRLDNQELSGSLRPNGP